jgi:hypothetical protein
MRYNQGLAITTARAASNAESALTTQPLDNKNTINKPANDGPPQCISIVDDPPMANTTTTNNPEARHQSDVRQENCSAPAHHLFAHMKNINSTQTLR